MKVEKIIPNQNIIKKTVEKSKKLFDSLGYELGDSGLPKEVPLEKTIYLTTARDCFERTKEAIEIASNKIKNQEEI